MQSGADVSIDRAAKGIINQIAAIIRTAQIHNPKNATVVKAIERLMELLRQVFEISGDHASLELIGEYFYMNETRVKFSMDQLINFDYLLREFKKFHLGGITFTDDVEAADFQDFLQAFISSAFADSPFDDLAMAVDHIKGISVTSPRQEKQQDKNPEKDMRKTVKKTYFNAVSYTKGVMNKIKSGEKVNIKRAKRVVQSMVDVLLTQEDLLLGMTAIKDYDDYTYHHSVNVSIVSIALGQKLGFSKQALQELGLLALFHDIGKMEIPNEVLNKPSKFTEDEWKIVQKHPVWGVRAILKMKGYDHISIKAAIVAFEHHLYADGSGYPETKLYKDLDLYSKIVSLADQYDGMTSSRVYSRTPMTPEKALSLMMERVNSQLDPMLFKFFVNMVGVYPVGTALVLNTRELALVYGNNMSFPDKPRVLVITDSTGKKVHGRLIDLTERNAEGEFKRKIARTLDPSKYKINLAEYML